MTVKAAAASIYRLPVMHKHHKLIETYVKNVLNIVDNTYMIVIHRQRYAKSLFIIFAITAAAAAAAGTGAGADDEVFVGVANIFVGCVCRRWNGVC